MVPMTPSGSVVLLWQRLGSQVRSAPKLRAEVPDVEGGDLAGSYARG